MAVHSLWCVVAAIVVLVVMVHPHRAASARFGVKSVDQGDLAVAGLCSLANIMHAGYRCQEYNVSRSFFSVMFVIHHALINRTTDQSLIHYLSMCI